MTADRHDAGPDPRPTEQPRRWPSPALTRRRWPARAEHPQRLDHLAVEAPLEIRVRAHARTTEAARWPSPCAPPATTSSWPPGSCSPRASCARGAIDRRGWSRRARHRRVTLAPGLAAARAQRRSGASPSPRPAACAARARWRRWRCSPSLPPPPRDAAAGRRHCAGAARSPARGAAGLRGTGGLHAAGLFDAGGALLARARTWAATTPSTRWWAGAAGGAAAGARRACWW